MIICVDFDGTIVDHRFPGIGEPVPEAIKWLTRLQGSGARIILYTMRSDNMADGDLLSQAVDYLEERGVELYGVNCNPEQESWTMSPKVFGHVYVDDAAFGCPLVQLKSFSRPCVDWDVVGPELERIILGR